jgi:hypothetical protein
MRGRIVLFVVLAVVAALVGVYVERSTNTPTAVGEPETATPLDSSVGSTQRRGSGSGPSRSPTASPHTAGSPNTDANRDRNRTQPGQQPPPPPVSQPNTNPVRFGKVTTTPSDKKTIETDLAEGGRAFSLGFSDRDVTVPEGSTRDATRSFALTLPLTDGAKGGHALD